MRLCHREVGTEQWYFTMGNIKDSACPAWPADKRRLQGTSVDFFMPRTENGRMEFVVLLDHTMWETLAYDWYAPAFQYARIPACRAHAGA